MAVLFSVFVALLLWCYAGYPLCMALRARLRPRPWRAGPPERGGISIVLAVRNGADLVEDRIANLLSLAHPGGPLEVVVACNGCTDDTEARVRAVAARNPVVRVLSSPGGQGKSGALNAGVAQATGEFLVFADARQRFAADALERLLEPFADPAVGAVSGRLVIGRGDGAAVEGVRWYWGFETALRLAESRTGSVPGVTGAIYAVRRSLFPPLPPNLILDDLYVPMHVVMAGYRTVLAPAAVAFDVASADDRHEYLRKRRTMVGNLQLLRVLPGLLRPGRNPILARYLSHKLLRMATPVCTLGIVATAAFLPGSVFQAIFWAGVAGYALGCAGLALRVRLLAVPAAFVLVHLAIVSALLRFRGDAGAVWTGPDEAGAAVALTGSGEAPAAGR